MIAHRGRVVTIMFLLPLLMLQQLVDSGETLVRCIKRERQALLTFKQGLVDDYGLLSSWGTDDREKECCKWSGVGCSYTTGHVTSLQLDSVRGKISPALLELKHLNTLSLSNFDVGGIIPKFIGSIKSLQHLYLRYCEFSGSIPHELGNLTNLRTLDLEGNYMMFSENLYWLSHLTKLSFLNLDSAKYVSDTNWVQHVILNVPSLQTLSLVQCMLTDPVTKYPAHLFLNSSSSSSLSYLHLSHNNLTSSTFDWLFNISTSLVYIDLSSNELDGPIPDAFGKLTPLQWLDLDGNMLEGVIPKSFGNLSHLQFLSLFGNHLKVPLEDILGNLPSTRLEYLELSNTQVTGSVPVASLGRLDKLKSLGLSNNSLQGTISESHFINLGNLQSLSLSFNSLTLALSPNWIPPFIDLIVIDLAGCNMGPSFPAWLHTQKDIRILDLSNNSISGEVPKWFWNHYPRYSASLKLSNNQMSGTIPDISSILIRMIDVSSNKFSGPLPLLHPSTTVVQLSQNRFSGPNISSYICGFTNHLQLLDLSNNQLAGTFPNCWERMEELVVLNLNNNSLSGEISHVLGSLSNLRSLHLGNNNLSGELPSTLKNCRLLQLIDMGGNNLTGNIPPWLGEVYSNMMHLVLRRNSFYGGIPHEICMLAQLQILDLSGNSISGKIPQCFNNVTSLVETNNSTTTTTIRIKVGFGIYIDYALVQWKGQESEYKNNLGLLKLIDLSSNRLFGSIPNAFSNLRGLYSLNLSRNGLTGNIDPNIGEMKMLECLDLSRNQLSGEIPIGFTRLNFLSVLNLSNNHLSGKIPLGTQLQSFDESAFVGNSELCGKPLKLCPKDDLKPIVGEDMMDENDGLFGLSFMQEFGISMTFGFIVGFWGIVGSLLLKKSWRSAFIKLSNAIGDWLFVTTTLFLNKFNRN